MEKNSNKKNTNALFIGIGLILLIVAISSFKTSSKNDQAQKKDPQAQENEKNMNVGKSLKISNSELAEKLNQANLSIIDIRDAESYEREHIPNSLNIPADTVLDTISSFNKEKDYVIVDFDSQWQIAASITGKLVDAGFKRAVYLDGGFKTWKGNFQSTASEGDPNSFTDQAKVKYIQTDDLKKLMESVSNLAIIDVRESQEFKAGHIKNALNIPWNNIEQRRNDIPSGKKIVLYDNTGLLAFKSAVKLFDVGIFNALTLSDGLNTWREKKFEIVK